MSILKLAKDKKEDRKYVKGDYIVVVIDTEGKGYCPLYTKVTGRGIIPPKRSAPSITFRNDIIFLTSREPNTKVSLKGIYHQLRGLREECEERGIKKIFLPLHFWCRQGMFLYSVSLAVVRAFRKSDIKVIC